MQIILKKITQIFNFKKLDSFQALVDVSLKINMNEFITIIGESGSGKTTLIEHFNVLLRPSIGEIDFVSLELAKLLKKNKKKIKKMQKISNIAFNIKNNRKKIKEIKLLRKKIGIVFQFAEYQLFEETIEKDIIFGPISMGVSKKKALLLAKKYIKLVGLDESFLQKSPFSISGGQKRRVALAGILAMEPNILICDEPTSGLDPQGTKDIYKIFQILHKLGKTIIIVTHNMDHVLKYSTRTIVLKNGKLIKDDLSVNIMYDQNLLIENHLETPKLVNLVYALEKKGKKIGKIRTIKEFVERI